MSLQHVFRRSPCGDSVISLKEVRDTTVDPLEESGDRVERL